MTIVSHKYKFIFIKTFKTASSTLEACLSRFCGKDDVVTSLGTEEDGIRRQMYGVKPQNYFRTVPLSKYHKDDWAKLIFKRCRLTESIFTRHMPAWQIKAKLGEDIWNEYFKFCFVRNPWDRALSNYYFCKGNGSVSNLDEYFKGNYGINNNYHMYTINDELAVDFLGRYETLNEDFDVVCKKLNIPFDGQLLNLKGNYKSPDVRKKHYSEVWTPEQSQIIAHKCSKEIALLGYDFI